MTRTLTTDALTLTDSVGEWVTRYPAIARIFEQHGIDYCCGGARPLDAACESRDADAQSVLAELQAAISQTGTEFDDNFSTKTLTGMCDEIVDTHHEYLKRELSRLTQLVDKVRSVHGEAHPWLQELSAAFGRLRDELVPHMFKEEHILFPAIRTIEQSQSVPRFPFGSVDNPIHMMEHEHDAAGQALREMRDVSRNFTAPDDACNTFRVMLDGLRELELDLHQHIHKENNVLFPRASQLAAELTQPACAERGE
ncbi:iron-sulfur cluster repair di-iron protein [bacterium]|nr:iron-sulfur cluster repair di-iron protein [bacterium]